MKDRILPVLIQCGYAIYLTLEIWQARWDDFLSNRKTTWRQKVWAHRRGFWSDRIAKYGLTDTNCHEYLSDFTYKRLYNINGIYSRWIDDKLVIRYLLEPFRDYLPEYYFQVKRGQVTPLPDLPSGYIQNPDGIMKLLTDEGDLVFKPMGGSYGIGFYRLSCTNKTFYINNQLATRDDMIGLISQAKNYIVTQYITSHEDIRRIYAGSPNTLRVLAINPPGSDLILSNAHLRFGTSASGVVDFTTNGGLFSTVDLNTGKFSGGMKFMKHYAESCNVHPDTGASIEGVLPHLEIIKQKLGEISLYLPQLKFMGYDIIVTANSFKIIEINSHPAIASQQHHKPIFRDEGTREFFFDLINKQRRG